MSRTRYEIKGEIEVLSPLHVGTGATRQVSSVKGADDGRNALPDVASIVRDADDRPYIPPTSLKGLLRRLGENVMPERADRVDILFGNHDKGRAGALLVRGATLKSAADKSQMPFVAGAEQELGRGVFIAARTAIDPQKGVAEDHKLFHAEMVAAGAKFDLRLIVEVRGEDSAARAKACLDDLLEVLGRLVDDSGHGLGRGTADGEGRIRLIDNSVTINQAELASNGDYKAKPSQDLWTKRRKASPASGSIEARLVLVADGPFLVADASRKPRRRQEADARRPQLSAQRVSEERPLILGSGLSGPLRARARWFAALDGVAAPEGPSRVADLTTVQRLFGTTAFKGLLTIEVTCLNKPKLWTAASVKIDRFTGGPVQNALFHTQAFVGTRLALTLRLKSRAGAGALTEADRRLFDRLVADVRDNGLMLGHGVNRGYGWFRTEAA